MFRLTCCLIQTLCISGCKGKNIYLDFYIYNICVFISIAVNKSLIRSFFFTSDISCSVTFPRSQPSKKLLEQKVYYLHFWPKQVKEKPTFSSPTHLSSTAWHYKVIQFENNKKARWMIEVILFHVNHFCWVIFTLWQFSVMTLIFIWSLMSKRYIDFLCLIKYRWMTFRNGNNFASSNY